MTNDEPKFRLEMSKDTSLDDALLTFLLCDQLYRGLGGSGLRIAPVSKNSKENTHDSPEIRIGSRDAPSKLVNNPLYGPGGWRGHVYDLVQRFIRPEYVPKVCIELNRMFPYSEHGDLFPLEGTCKTFLDNRDFVISLLPRDLDLSKTET